MSVILSDGQTLSASGALQAHSNQTPSRLDPTHKVGFFIYVILRFMSSWLIATIGVVYLYIGVDLIVKGQVGMGIAYLGYSLGNVGLYMESIK